MLEIESLKDKVMQKWTRRNENAEVNDSRSGNVNGLESPKRRSMLSSIAAGVGGSAVASTGFSGSVAATAGIDQETKERMKGVAEEYSNENAVQKAVETHAQDLLGELSDQGLLELGSVDTLPTSRLLSREEFTNAGEGVLVLGVLAADRPTAHIMIKRDLGSQELVIIVEPHVDRSFATVSAKDSESAETKFVQTGANTEATCTCATGEACLMSCHTSDGCSCAHFEVECCPNCCECHIGSQVPGGPCSSCHQDCWAATSCSCT